MDCPKKYGPCFHLWLSGRETKKKITIHPLSLATHSTTAASTMHHHRPKPGQGKTNGFEPGFLLHRYRTYYAGKSEQDSEMMMAQIDVLLVYRIRVVSRSRKGEIANLSFLG